MLGASQAVGVTQAALVQSNLATESVNTIFQIFASGMWTYLAGLVKLAWANKEKFAPIIGETGINFLEEDLRLELDDYAVFVEEINPIFEDKQMFSQMVIAALQSQQIEFLDAMKLLREKDITKGIREFEKAANKTAKEREMKQREMMAMQQQAELEKQQAMMQGQQQANQIAAQGRIADTKLKSATDLQKEDMKGKYGLAKEKLSGKERIANEIVKSRTQLRNDIEKRKYDKNNKQ